MTAEIEIGREGRLGVVTLDRPQAINALSRDMIDAIAAALAAWRDDPDVAMVLFEGRGPRGFCAGGDVRAVRQAVIEGRAAEADAYFAAEYAMNAVIAGYKKPLVALTHGAVMGGGIGIAGHCTYRITTEGAKFAMPEAAIGFVCDVGINLIMAQAPLNRAMLFLLTGASVGPADALALGLADAMILPERREALRAGVVAAAGAADPDAALRALIEREAVDPGEAGFCARGDRFIGARWAAAEDVLADVEAAGEAELLAQLRTRSPTSLVAIALSHIAARRLPLAADVLALDLALACHVARLPDFAEGVRAVLVDKDQRPNWMPAGLGEVEAAGIRAALGLESEV